MVRAPGWPEGLALVAVNGRPSILMISVAMDWLEIRTPMPRVEFIKGAGMLSRAGGMMVSGPGQKCAISFSASSGISATNDINIDRSETSTGKGLLGLRPFS